MASVETPELTTGTRAAVRDLILCMADSKRLLGMRYANWILGAPELEAGIACASMAQDEWGHARLLYALLKDFGDDVDALEHGREPEAYRNMEALDQEPEGWTDVVALNALADTALSVQFEALRGSSFEPLRQRVEKMLEEERFHAAHGAAWLRRLASVNPAARAQIRASVDALQPGLLRWFGPDSERARALAEEGVVDAAGSELRQRYVRKVASLLAALGDDAPTAAGEPSFDGFDEATRRTPGGAPDAGTIRQIRGDKNRVFLMD